MKIRIKGKANKQMRKLLIYLVLIVVSVFLMFPFYWMLVTSFKSSGDVFISPIQWMPHPFTWKGYQLLFTEFNFLRYVWNSTWLTAVNIVGYVLSTAMVSYAFATLKWKYKNKLFLFVIATMMLPKTVVFYPQFILFKYLGWYGTMAPLWVPSLFADAFLIFLMRQFFLTIPTELSEAAMLDGCSKFRIFWNIYMPLSKPVLASATIFVFMYTWNDFFGPLIFITQDNMRTAALALMYLTNSFGINTLIPTEMAGAVVCIIPCIMLFYFAQRYFIAGVVVKGVEK